MLNKIKYTLKSTIVYSIGNISLKLIGLILLPVYTDNLLLEEYGQWALLEVTSQIFVIIVGFRLSISLIRFFSSEKEESSKRIILFSSFALSLISVFFFNTILHPFSDKFSYIYFGNGNQSTYFHLLIIWSSLEVMNRLSLDFIRVMQKPILFVLASIIRFTLVLGLNIYFVAHREMGIEGILWGQLIGSAFLFLLTTPFLISRMKIGWDIRIIKELISYGIPIIFSSMAMFMLTLGDRYLIKILLEYERVGIYSLSYKIASVIKLILIQAFQLGFIPIVFNMFGKTDFRRFVTKISTYYIFVLFFASLALSVFSKEIVYSFARDPNYYEAYLYIPYMLFAFCFQALQYVFTIGLHYVKKVRYFVWITLVSGLIHILLSWFFLPRIGLYGSVLAVNISSLFMAGITYIIAQRFYAIPYEIKKILLIIISSLIIYSLTLLVPEDSLLISILIKLFLIGLYPLILYLMKFYDALELETIKQGWKTWKNPVHWKENISRIMKEGMDDDKYI
jgi:O-antigen/teichoic acid export membrane protein